MILPHRCLDLFMGVYIPCNLPDTSHRADLQLGHMIEAVVETAKYDQAHKESASDVGQISIIDTIRNHQEPEEGCCDR